MVSEQLEEESTQRLVRGDLFASERQPGKLIGGAPSCDALVLPFACKVLLSGSVELILIQLIVAGVHLCELSGGSGREADRAQQKKQKQHITGRSLGVKNSPEGVLISL